MAREIKFRARHTKTGEWYYGTNKECLNDHEMDLSLFFQQVEDDILDPKTVGQFINCYDEDGKEIYGGSILQISDPVNGGYANVIVASHLPRVTTTFANSINSPEISWGELSTLPGWVIGDIYTTPDLLKGKE